MRWLFRLILASLMMHSVLEAVPAAGMDPTNCVVPGGISMKRPDPKGAPTEVLIGTFVNKIMGINDIKQTFTADIFMGIKWKDPRLVDESQGGSLAGCKVPLDEVWNPRVLFLNGGTLSKHLEDSVVIDSEGLVIYRQRFSGEFSIPFQLSEFPFDRHLLAISIVAAGYDIGQVRFVLDKRILGQTENLSLVDWSIDQGMGKVTTYYFAPQDRNFPLFNYELSVERYQGFYLSKVIIPLTMIIFMSWTVFQLNLGNYLPKISYLTRMDRFVLGALILVFLALVETVTSGALAEAGKPGLAKKIDQRARIVFPLAFIFVLAFAFWI